MSLENKSTELKDFVAQFDTQWFLGHLSQIMSLIHTGMAQAEIEKLSSPLRQLYYLGGLLISSDEETAKTPMCSPDQWDEIVTQLNEIESEYDNLFLPKKEEIIDDEWKRIRQIAMPSFLSYFNQGPLNYEEQTISWVERLYTPLDDQIESKTGLTTADLLLFYEKVDELVNRKTQGFMGNNDVLDEKWLEYTNLKMGVREGTPPQIAELMEEKKALYSYMTDPGLARRFKASDIANDDLPLEKVNLILGDLTCQRSPSDFQFYTSTKPGNPLYRCPLVDIGNDIFEVFEVKQIIHAIEGWLEDLCSSTPDLSTTLSKHKGKLLEIKVRELFEDFLGSEVEVYESYYVDGCEQDLLILWEDHAFIVECKGYNIREPFRDPNKAFVRIKDDFNGSIGYGFDQCRRVAQKFVDQVPVLIEDSNGKVVKELDTAKYDGKDYSIIVNLRSFGQIQNDLSTLLTIGEDDCFPWVVKLDDLEVIFLYLQARGKDPDTFVNYLSLREELHGKLICGDELEIFSAFCDSKISERKIRWFDGFVTSPDWPKIIDKQYAKGLGFKNEKYWEEKTSGKYLVL